MSRPLRFRYVHALSGLFVLLAFGLLVGLVILAGKGQGWLEPRMRLQIRLPEQGSYGLIIGSEVQMLGTVIGYIERIHLSNTGQMEATAVLKGDFITFVRQDSGVVIKKKFGIAGDAFVDIERGRGNPLEPQHPALAAVIDEEILAMIQNAVKEIRHNIVPVLEKIGATADEYGQLARDLRHDRGQLLASFGSTVDEYALLAKSLRESRGPLTGVLNEAAALMADMRSPQGPIHSVAGEMQALINDARKGPGTVGRLLQERTVLDQLDQLLTELQATAEQLRKTSRQLPTLAKRLDRDYAKLPATVEQAQQALFEAESLIDTLSNHWLLRGSGQPDDGSKPLESQELIVP